MPVNKDITKFLVFWFVFSVVPTISKSHSNDSLRTSIRSLKPWLSNSWNFCREILVKCKKVYKRAVVKPIFRLCAPFVKWFRTFLSEIRFAHWKLDLIMFWKFLKRNSCKVQKSSQKIVSESSSLLYVPYRKRFPNDSLRNLMRKLVSTSWISWRENAVNCKQVHKKAFSESVFNKCVPHFERFRALPSEPR
jgi:hypothetical protein